MNPHYVAAQLGAKAARAKCPACGERLRQAKPDSHGQFTCQKCGYKFSARPEQKTASR